VAPRPPGRGGARAALRCRPRADHLDPERRQRCSCWQPPARLLAPRTGRPLPASHGGGVGGPMDIGSAVVTRVNGPVVDVSFGEGLAMLDLVHVGPQRLPGEVIALAGTTATVQVYEYTGGLKPGDVVLG